MLYVKILHNYLKSFSFICYNLENILELLMCPLKAPAVLTFNISNCYILVKIFFQFFLFDVFSLFI